MSSMGFTITISQFRFHKVHTWEDLEAAATDVLYEHFLHAGKKAGENVFKPNVKCEVALVVPSLARVLFLPMPSPIMIAGCSGLDRGQ
ncbi:hypothetical protein K439DRAFT_1631101 [Ramaria rubella]|nr:hypothetical protein K439DRAFT_1631101 [Ramaria rubella]